jgi:hypothetical protein
VRAFTDATVPTLQLRGMTNRRGAHRRREKKKKKRKRKGVGISK